MRNLAGIGLFAVALLGTAQVRADVTLGPGDTLDWDANTPAATEKITATGGTLAAGDYPLVSGKTLAGLTDCTLVRDIGHGMKAKLVRTESALVLRVMPSGITVIFR